MIKIARKTGAGYLLFMIGAALIAFTLSGCGATGSNSAQERTGGADASWDAMEKLRSIPVEEIDSIDYQLETEGGAYGQTVEDANTIEDIYTRLLNVRIEEKSTMGVDDDGMRINVNTDEVSLSFYFERDILVLTDQERYEVSGIDGLKRYLQGLNEKVFGDGDEYREEDAIGDIATDISELDDRLDPGAHVNKDGSTEIVLDGVLHMTLPAEWLDEYEIVGRSDILSFYHSDSLAGFRKNGMLGGMLFAVMVSDGDPGYTEEYYLGDAKDGAEYYMLIPQELTGFAEDEDILEEYEGLASQINMVRKSAYSTAGGSPTAVNGTEEASDLSSGEKSTIGKAFADSSVRISPTEAQSVSLSTYREPNGYFTMEIPDGWTIQTGGDYISYEIMVSDPSHEMRDINVILSMYGWEDQTVAKMGPNYGGTDLWIPEATTQSFFESIFSKEGGNFVTIETIGQIGGGDVLHATAFDSDANEREGIYTATVFRLNADIGMNFSQIWAEGILCYSAAPEEFTDWQPVLDECIGSLSFSDSFWQLRNQEWQQVTQQTSQIRQSYNSISDQIMSSWEKRTNSYDIRMQEQSDATLGYDRIIDTQTGETYRASMGFLDGYEGTRYKKVESGSSLYNQAVSGYIDTK